MSAQWLVAEADLFKRSVVIVLRLWLWGNLEWPAQKGPTFITTKDTKGTRRKTWGMLTRPDVFLRA